MKIRKSTYRPWPALAVLCLANFLILLDTSVVNTAAPDLMRSLNTGIDGFLWILNGYLLALGSLLVAFARLGDRCGPRRIFLVGLVTFTVASVLCGIGQSSGQVVAARVLQGIGAAAMLPQALTIIAGIFPARRRGAAFGVFAAVAGIAAVSGPTLGGLLITAQGWQWIFFLNVPIGLAGLLFGLRLVPEVRNGARHRFDAGGMVLATAGLVLMVYSLVEGERYRWGTVAGWLTIPRLLIASAVLLTAFVLWERRQPEPLLPLALFGNRAFTVATSITMITSFALYGFLLVFVIETQTLLGMSPAMSGVTALPWTLALSAVAPVTGRLTDRVGGRPLLVGGLLFYALGVIGVATLPGAHATAADFILPLIALGIGMGAAIAPATTEALRDVPGPLAASASGVLNTARQLGGALGAAVTGAVLQSRLATTLAAAAQHNAGQLPPGQRAPFVAGFIGAAQHGLQLGAGQHAGVQPPPGLPDDQADHFGRLVTDTFADAFLPAARTTLFVVAGVLLAGALLAMLLRPSHTRSPETEPEQATADAARHTP